MHEKAGPQCCPFDDIELPASPANELSKLLIDAGDAVTRQENCDSPPAWAPSRAKEVNHTSMQWRTSNQMSAVFPQWAITMGRFDISSMSRVAPPSIHSCAREWP